MSMAIETTRIILYNSKVIMSTMKLTAVIRKEGSHYVAKCPEVGTVSQGITPDEALENLRHATEVYIGLFPMDLQGDPIYKTFEISVKTQAV